MNSHVKGGIGAEISNPHEPKIVQIFDAIDQLAIAIDSAESLSQGIESRLIGCGISGATSAVGTPQEQRPILQELHNKISALAVRVCDINVSLRNIQSEI